MKFTIGGLDASPTKGYRALARPRKANSRSRRRLIPQGRNNVPLSHEARVEELRWNPVLHQREAVRSREVARVEE